MQTILAAFRDQSVVRECAPELVLPQSHEGERRVRLALLFWLLLALALVGLLAADWFVSGSAERSW